MTSHHVRQKKLRRRHLRPRQLTFCHTLESSVDEKTHGVSWQATSHRVRIIFADPKCSTLAAKPSSQNSDFKEMVQSRHLSSKTNSYRKNELEKKRVYGKRVRMVDQASFTPLIFSCLGGMGKESLVFYKRLANSLAEQRNQEYSATSNWLRSRLSFCLIRSCLICLRGSRSVFAKHVTEKVIEVERAVW